MIEQILGILVGFIEWVISHFGAFGISLLMAIESCNIPLPSEAILPFAGYLITIGKIPNIHIAAIFGMSLMSVFVYCLKLMDKAVRFRAVMRFFGKYSLELYLLHVTMRNLMETMGLQDYRTSRYALMIILAVALAPVLHKMTVWTQEHVLTGQQQSE